MLKRRNYEIPHTEKGLDLSRPDNYQATNFTIHEMGYEEINAWRHISVISPYWRIIYNLDPGYNVLSNQKKYDLDDSQIIVVPENVFFDTQGDQLCRHHWIFFSTQSDLISEINEPLLIKANDHVKLLFKKLRYAKLNSGGLEQMRKLFYISQSIVNLAFIELSSRSYHIYPEKILFLLNYIKQNLDHSLSNQILADLVHLNVKTFLRWFKKYVGESPTQYMTRKRIQQACLELTMTDDPLEIIAERLGFPNRYYFTRVFTKKMGQGPAKYRKNPSAYL
jgi:AraC-like DNA-binding protein